MLVVSLKTDGFVQLRLADGTLFAVQLCEIRPDKVRIGIVAPKSVTVLRGELVAQNTGRTPQNVLAQIKEQCRD